MEHISGDIGQSVRHDFGDFIELGGFRFRKEQVIMYGPIYISHDNADDSKHLFFGPHGIQLFISGVGRMPISISTNYEDVTKELNRLDWIYKKDSK